MARRSRGRFPFGSEALGRPGKVAPGRPSRALAYNGLVTAGPSLSPTVPRTIHADREAGTLSIGWQDGHPTVYDFVALRWLCPCAYCRGEAGMPGWLDSRPTLSPDQTRMVDIQLVGNYAVAPSWADGHRTGYYTFTVLRERCPCPECSKRRAAEPALAGANPSGHLTHAAPAPHSEESR
jgi:DUF971 family protein